MASTWGTKARNAARQLHMQVRWQLSQTETKQSLFINFTFWDFRQFPGSIGWPTKREHGAKNFFGAIGGLTLEQVPLRLKEFLHSLIFLLRSLIHNCDWLLWGVANLHNLCITTSGMPRGVSEGRSSWLDFLLELLESAESVLIIKRIQGVIWMLIVFKHCSPSMIPSKYFA